MGRRLEFGLVVLLAASFFAWFAWPLVWSASANSRLVATFSADESVHLQIVRRAVQERTFRIGYESYGYLYFNLAIAPLLLARLFGEVSDQAIILTLRAISTLFGIGTICLAFAFARRCFGRVAGWLAAALMALSCLEFLDWSVVAHPDIPQDFFFLLGVYFCCRLAEDGRLRWLVWASAGAGLAFATKYSGVFLLPTLWALGAAQSFGPADGEAGEGSGDFVGPARLLARVTAGLCCVGAVVALFGEDHRSRDLGIWLGLALVLLAFSRWAGRRAERSPRLAGAVCRAVLCVLVFGLTFFAASPYSFRNWDFIGGILMSSGKLSFGHGFREAGSGLLWFPLLVSERGLNVVVFGLALAGLVPIAAEVRRKGWRRLLSPDAVVWATVAFFLAYLVFRVQQRRLRFILLAVPPLVVLSTAVVGLAVGWASRRWGRRGAVLAALVAVGVVGGIVLPPSISRLSAFRRDMRGREETSVRMQAGRWLAEQFDPSCEVLADHYAYVPPAFQDMAFTFGGKLSDLEKRAPDVVVVVDEVSGRYADPERGEDFRDGEDRYRQIHDYYRALRAGTAGYELARDFGEVQIYRKAH